MYSNSNSSRKESYHNKEWRLCRLCSKSILSPLRRAFFYSTNYYAQNDSL